MKISSLYQRAQVIALSGQGFSQHFIAGHLHIPRSTIGSILAGYKEDGHVHDCPRSGRPRLLSIRDERLAVRMLNEPKSGNAVAVGRKLRAQGLRLSDETVHRSFRRQGLGSKVKKKKPLSTMKHRQKRLQWAKASKDCEVEDWSHVIFSDESKFNVFGSDGRQWCWKNPTEPLRDCHVQPTVKHGGGSIMVWGCMSWAGVENAATATVRAVAAPRCIGAGVGCSLECQRLPKGTIAWQECVKNRRQGSNESEQSGCKSHLFGCRKCPSASRDYAEEHFICNIVMLQEDSLFLRARMHLLPQARVEQGSKPGRRARLKKKCKAIISRSMRLSKSPSLSEPQLGGGLELTELQNVNHPFSDQHVGITTTQFQNGKHPTGDKYVGLNTGRQSRYTITNAEDHWATFQKGSACEKSAAPTIAVVNWTAQVITMFIKVDWEKETYYRNYQVHKSNLALFEEEYAQFAVLSGAIGGGGGRLSGTNSQIVVAKDDRKRKLKSDNSWRLLGFGRDPGVKFEKFVFLAMKRAAVFGIIECLYKDPTLPNVDMLDGGNECEKEFVHVVTPHEDKLRNKPDNVFSVFAFNATGHSNEHVLVS